MVRSRIEVSEVGGAGGDVFRLIAFTALNRRSSVNPKGSMFCSAARFPARRGEAGNPGGWTTTLLPTFVRWRRRVDDHPFG